MPGNKSIDGDSSTYRLRGPKLLSVMELPTTHMHFLTCNRVFRLSAESLKSEEPA